MNKLRRQRIYKEDGLSYMMKNVSRLKKTGTTYKASCPFHNERTPSLTIYPKGFNGQDHETFYCFGCHQGGDIIKFKMLLDNVSYKEALSLLEQEFEISEINDNTILEFITEELQVQNHSALQVFSNEHILLLIANLCRKYLEFVKEHYPNKFIYEQRVIYGYYRYIDYIIGRYNNNDMNKLWIRLKNKLACRRLQL